MGRLDGLLGKTEECGKEGEREGGRERGVMENSRCSIRRKKTNSVETVKREGRETKNRSRGCSRGKKSKSKKKDGKRSREIGGRSN